MSAAPSVIGRPRVDFDRDVEERLGQDDAPLDGDSWWCVRTAPYPCPAGGCGFVAMFITAAHRIVVWPRRDDRVLLNRAADAKQLGRDPRVVRYEEGMGPAISYDAWKRIGCPVHALGRRPEGKPRPTF